MICMTRKALRLDWHAMPASSYSQVSGLLGVLGAFPLHLPAEQLICLIPQLDVADGGDDALREQRLAQYQLQYAAGRACAAQLLHKLGAAVTAVGRADDRSPQWPAGFVGSITHSDEVVGVAVMPCASGRSLGIDLEPMIATEAVDEIQAVCLSGRERVLWHQSQMSLMAFTTLCFSAKEALYKCLYPIVGVFFEFHDVEIQSINVASQTLQVRLLRQLSAEFSSGMVLLGRYRITQQHVLTAFEL
jgi:enterobactin synthetase component D